jgi:hypothetical protein
MRILYVPLDNRPVNTTNVVKQGEASGFEIVMPTAYIGGKPLDPTNDFGNPDSIVSWIDSQIGGSFDGFILSTDMIAFGGLIPSRELVYSDTEASSEVSAAKSRLDVIDRIQSAYPGKPIYLLDTVMRLASTSYVSGLDQDSYSNFRRMMGEPRREYTNHGDIKSGYAHMPGSGSYQSANYGLSGTDVLAYYRKRGVKFDINWYTMEKVRANSDTFVVYGVDDANRDGVQINEINWLKGRINAWLGGYQGQHSGRAMIMPDADGLGMALLGKMATKHYGIFTDIYVSYFGTHGSQITNAYEYLTIDENIDLHIKLMGARRATSRSAAQVDLLVQTTVGYHNSLVSQMNSNYVDGLPSAVIGIVNDKALAEAVLSSSNGPRLLSFSTWNTAGNRMGIALGHANGRYNYVRATAGSVAATEAQSELLAKEFIIDFGYIQEVRGSGGTSSYNLGSGLRAYINGLGGRNHPDVEKNFNRYTYSGSNSPLSSTERASAVNRLRSDMTTQVDKILKNFCGRRIIHSVSGDRSIGYMFHAFNSYDVTNTVNSMDFIWDRTFEISVEPHSTVQEGLPSCPTRPAL